MTVAVCGLGRVFRQRVVVPCNSDARDVHLFVLWWLCSVVGIVYDQRTEARGAFAKPTKSAQGEFWKNIYITMTPVYKGSTHWSFL